MSEMTTRSDLAGLAAREAGAGSIEDMSLRDAAIAGIEAFEGRLAGLSAENQRLRMQHHADERALAEARACIDRMEKEFHEAQLELAGARELLAAAGVAMLR
jgi:hypothetical protein